MSEGEGYLARPLWYKIRKVARYTRMYGPRRTFAKVKSQLHMSKGGQPLQEDWFNPRISRAKREGEGIAILGCGGFGYSNIAYYASREAFPLRCAYDPASERAKSLVSRYAGVYAARDPFQAIQDPLVTTVFVSSNHSTHATYAIAAIRAGKRVHIEKPHVVDSLQLHQLMQEIVGAENANVYLGFNRPRSGLYRQLREALDAEVGPLMVNWFVAGHELEPDHWYFAEAEGGRILGNLCHWTDLTLRLVGLEQAFPISVEAAHPSGSKSDVVVNLQFGDGSAAGITFSAKGHLFDGVSEILNIHRGSTLATLTDFASLEVRNEARRYVTKPFFRDHGHREAIVVALRGEEGGESIEYIMQSARLFLAVRDAALSGQKITLDRVDSEWGKYISA